MAISVNIAVREARMYDCVNEAFFRGTRGFIAGDDVVTFPGFVGSG